MLRAMVTLHDVMPENRHAIQGLLEFLSREVEHLQPADITLLVVPGRDWPDRDLAWLRQLVARGHPLAGHGWSHRAQPPASVYHWLHSLLLSRDVAEHLSRSAMACFERVQRCHHWFAQNRLPVPDFYVPPAWAMGAFGARQRAASPFRFFEDLGGLHDKACGRYQRLPLVGFEADSPWRAGVLRLFNGWNLRRARQTGRTLRIALHPHDSGYLLAVDIARHLNLVQAFTGVEGALSAGTQVAR